MRRAISSLLLMSLSAAPAVAAGGEFSGRLATLLAYRVAGEEEVAERDVLLDLEGRFQWHGWELYALGRGRYEDRLEPETYRELGLRELVLRKRGASYDLHLGRQQVVWGKADGLRLLDLVNPLDLREFLFDDFTDSRIPLWMVNAEVFRGDHGYQLLIIPDVEPHRLAAPGGEFALAEALAPDVPVTVGEVKEPGSGAGDWEYAFRWSALLGRLDLTANAFYGWNDTPVPFRSFSPGGLRVEPRIVRSRVLGFSGDLPLGTTVLRFEATYTPDEVREAAGVFLRQRVWRHVVGLDWIRNNWLLSPQWFQEEVVDPAPGLAGGERLSYLTLLVRKTLHQDRLTLRVFYAYGFEHRDTWLSPRIGYEMLGRVVVELGADLLDGRPAGVFGRFAERDRVTLQATVRF